MIRRLAHELGLEVHEFTLRDDDDLDAVLGAIQRAIETARKE